MNDDTPANRQFVICKFRPADGRGYTYHNDGPPVAIGDKVIVQAPRDEGKVTVEVTGLVDQAPPFPTKAILGLAPPKVEDEAKPE